MKYIPRYTWSYYNVKYYILHLFELDSYVCLFYNRECYTGTHITDPESVTPYFFTEIFDYTGAYEYSDIYDHIKNDLEEIDKLDYTLIEDTQYNIREAMKDIRLELRHGKIKKILKQ